jgi:UDP-N-acetylglucosamine diphosphorylase/glucosamine-1-phosphate N-acetyltransferase
MVRMIIFDDGLGQLGPMTDLRAVFEVRTGMRTTANRISASRPKALAGYWVPQHLAGVVGERANAPVNLLPNEEVVLCVNGRWALPDPKLDLNLNEAAVEQATGHVVAANFRRADAEYFLTTGQLHERTQVINVESRVLYRYPWDVLGMIKQTVPHDIMASMTTDSMRVRDFADVVGSYPVQVHESARIYPNVVLDAEHGPIMLQARAVIRPGAVICGPCAIGEDSTIVDRALIKANTVIGPWCKVGGEVGATIFQGFSNKSHEGHLGDSGVGRWVNFGAGTTNSNLLNTYGEITMRLDENGQRFRTGTQFLGAIVGDYVKFAINTRIMTGSAIGTGAMIAGTAAPPTTVRRFAWITDDAPESGRAFRLEKFLETARTMMARRHMQMSAAHEKLLRGLYEQSVGASQSR